MIVLSGAGTWNCSGAFAEVQCVWRRTAGHILGAEGANNLHTSSNARVSSNGCQNVPIQQYVQFISEIQNNKDQAKANSNKSLTIQYVLKDASKIVR